MIKYDDEYFEKIIKGSTNTVFRSVVSESVSTHFRSIRNKSSAAVCDCVILDLILNDVITPYSAEDITKYMCRVHRNINANVESALFPISDEFEDYARKVLDIEYSAIKMLGIKTLDYIVFVLASGLVGNSQLNREEVILNSFTYEELLNLE